MTKGWKKEPARHSLAGKGVKTVSTSYRPHKINKTSSDITSKDGRGIPATDPRIELPEVLFHGTSSKNILQILLNGFKTYSYEECLTKANPKTLESGFSADSCGNISMAVHQHDAERFGSLVLEIEVSKLDKRKLFFRSSLGSPDYTEAKYYGDIPASAIRYRHDWLRAMELAGVRT